VIAIALAASLASLTVLAQEPAVPAGDARPAPEIVPLDIQVVVSRVQNTKKISSLPYSLAVNASRDRPTSQLRMRASVPLPTTPARAVQTQKESSGPVAVSVPQSVRYQEMGTNIDAHARPLGDGRFEVLIVVEDTSIYQSTADQSMATADDMPVIRTFRVQNTLLLRDGQTRQFTAATDRVSGEVVQIEVTLRVVK
jgi:hypothetical protein